MAMRGRRPGLFRRLGTPKVMIALGAFYLVFGGSMAIRPQGRGTGLTVVALGVVMLLLGLLGRRTEQRRARRTVELATKKSKSSKSSPDRPPAWAGRRTASGRSKGPKAGSHRLAGPSRYKPEAEPEPRRRFGRKPADGKD